MSHLLLNIFLLCLALAYCKPIIVVVSGQSLQCLVPIEGANDILEPQKPAVLMLLLSFPRHMSLIDELSF